MDGGLLTSLLDIVQRSGPAGALLASGIVGLAFAVILLAHFRGLWVGVRGEAQQVDFQQKLLTLVDKLTSSEDSLRKRIDDLSHDNTSLRVDVEELRVTAALLRSQRRRLIDYLRAVTTASAAGRGPLPGAPA